MAAAIVPNSTVSQNKPGAYKSIMEALKAAPTNSPTKYYIHVEAGVYNERVTVEKNMTNIVLMGDGAPTTKLRANTSFINRTSETGTLTVLGDGFMAEKIEFENYAGDGLQAAAVVTNANHVAYYQCTFLGFQDTLYAKSGNQFYKDCDIYGTVDFIFGNAAAVFQSCNIYARPSKPNETITFTAQNRIDPTQQSGFVIQNCKLTVAPGLEKVGASAQAYLGRPWSIYSTVVVMESCLDKIIQPAGWLEFKSASPVTDKLFYREFKNRGLGAATSTNNRRVMWQGYKLVADNQPQQVEGFTVGEFIDKDGWLQGTGIPFYKGFTVASDITPCNI